MTPQEKERTFNRALAAALQGTAVLFLGAGISYLCRNQANKPLPNGAALKHEFERECGLGRTAYPLDRIAGHFARQKGNEALFTFLNSALRVEQLDDSLREFLSLPWVRIYTTNYDNAVRVAKKNSRNPAPLTLSDPPNQVPQGSTIHLNGSIERVAPHDISEELTLTDSSYAADKLSNSAWSQFFRSDLRSAKSVIFLGYSLADIDISRLLLEDKSLIAKTVFVISPSADEIETSALGEFGAVFPIGFDELWTHLDRAQRAYTPPKFIQTFSALKELSPRLPVECSNSAVLLHQQLVYGEPPLGHIFNDLAVFDTNKFLVERTEISKAVKLMMEGRWRDIVITGELASGKTYSAIQLGKILHDKYGYRVFIAGDVRDLATDLRNVCQITDRVCIIFDQYRSYLDEISTYAAQRPDTHRLILTERLTTNDIFFEVLEPRLGNGNTHVVTLEKLDEVEAETFDALINYAGLWGELAGFPAQQRTRRILNDFAGSLYRVLLEIIQSKKVQSEIDEILGPLRHDEQAARFFISVFITNVIGIDFWINDWQSFYKIDDIRRITRQYREHINHFVSTDASLVRVRSGVLSAFLLHSFGNTWIRDCLVDMYGHAADESGTDPDFRRLEIELMKYSTLEPLFAGRDQQKLADLVNYYEEIRAFGSARNRSDYWLQFGIASTIYGDLQRAEIAFKNAYARERAQSRPNMTRIDNYFSRFEMKKAQETTDSSEAFSLFISGSARLGKQILLDNNRHYPFKTGRAFADIAARHYPNWSPRERKEFARITRNVRDKAIEWRTNNKNSHPDVEILIRETGRLLDRIGGSSTTLE